MAPGVEGINGLQISNAMHLSAWINDWIEIPVNADLYYEELKKRIDNSSFKKETKDVILDVSGTH